MNLEANDLAALLEEEIAVGEQLAGNLEAQRRALVAWDIEALIAGIETRSGWLRSLGELEERRENILLRAGLSNKSASLSRLIADCPPGIPAYQRLQSARARAHQIFTSLQADERNLYGVMENLLAHLAEAFTPFGSASVSLYGDSGAATTERPLSAFVRSKV